MSTCPLGQGTCLMYPLRTAFYASSLGHEIKCLYIYPSILSTTHINIVYTVRDNISKRPQLHIEMEKIGVLPEPEDWMYRTIISLFGILSENKEDQGQCYFCYEDIKRNEQKAMNMCCCHQKAHTKCFREWAARSTTPGTVKCGYCRTIFPDKELCWLCLERKVDTEELQKTRCCETEVHKKCVETVRETFEQLTFNFTIECGEITYCGCLWHSI